MSTLTREQCQALWNSLPGADKPLRYARAISALISKNSEQDGVCSVLADLLRSALGPLKTLTDTETQAEADQLGQLITHIECALDAYDAGRQPRADESETDVQDNSGENE